ncbi:MAG: hypothetical protein ACREJG_02870, partial [Candidatus Rokuibacteriota bacterium]
ADASALVDRLAMTFAWQALAGAAAVARRADDREAARIAEYPRHGIVRVRVIGSIDRPVDADHGQRRWHGRCATQSAPERVL